MAIKLGSAYGKVGLNTSGLVNGVKAGKASLQTLAAVGQQVGRAMQRAGKTMTLAITVPLTAATVMLNNAGKSFVGLQEGFRNFTEQAGTNSSEMMSDMQAASRGMLSQRDIMLTYNNAAGLVNETFANQLPDSMDLFAKASAATGHTVSQVTNDYVTGVGRQSKMILDNLGITVDLEKANAAYAASIGKNVNSLTAQEKKLALNAQAMELLEQKYGGMKSAADLTGSSSEQFSAAMQDLKDTLGKFVVEALAPTLKSLAELARDILPKVSAFLEKIPTPVINMMLAFVGLLAILGPVITILGSLITSISTIVGFVGSLTGASVSLAGIGTAIGGAATALGGFVVAAAPVILVIIAIVAAIAFFVWAFKNHGDEIKRGAQIMWTAMTKFFKDGWQGIKEIWGEGTEWLSESWASFMEKNEARMRKWGESLQNTWQKILDYFAEARQRIADIFNNANWGTIGKNIVWGIANGMLGGIPAAIKASVEAAKALKNSFDEELDIHSPSREFYKSGKMSIEGFILGLTSVDPKKISATMQELVYKAPSAYMEKIQDPAKFIEPYLNASEEFVSQVNQSVSVGLSNMQKKQFQDYYRYAAELRKMTVWTPPKYDTSFYARQAAQVGASVGGNNITMNFDNGLSVRAANSMIQAQIDAIVQRLTNDIRSH